MINYFRNLVKIVDNDDSEYTTVQSEIATALIVLYIFCGIIAIGITLRYLIILSLEYSFLKFIFLGLFLIALLAASTFVSKPRKKKDL